MKLKNTLIIGLATLTLISCNDFLDVDSPSSYNEDFVFSQETEISRALNGVYASILVGDLYGSAYQKTFNLNSDVDMQMYTGNVATHNSYARFDCDDQGGEIDKYWRASYKAIEDAKKNLIEVPTSGSTIPHEVIGRFCGGNVLLKPAQAGSGIAAGGPVRAVVELAGISDVTSKSLGSNTPVNMVRATIEGLKQLKRVEDVAALRGKSVEELLG